MKRIVWFIMVICVASACSYKTGSGNIETQNRNTGQFEVVNAIGAFKVEITQGSSIKVVVEADDNIINDIETSVNNGQLKIYVKDGMSLSDAHMKVFITVPEINKIISSAAAEVEAKTELKSSNKISFNASSGSSIKAAVHAPDIYADASSGATIDLNGGTQNFTMEVSSGSSVNAFDLLSENTNAEASSGGSAKVHASVKLNAKASSGGSVDYRGAASVISSESSGGSISKK